MCCALLLTAVWAAPSCSAEDAEPAAAPPEEADTGPAEPSMTTAAARRAAVPATQPDPTGKVHPCAGAGRWFPDGEAALAKVVDAYLDVRKPAIDAAPLALIVPHAGYRYSGACAGHAYAALKGHDYDRVILIGLSHARPLRKASVLRVDAYKTPLGSVPVDLAACDALLACPVVTEQPACHEVEWSCENQLPFLQRALDDFRMVELLVGDLTDADRAALAEAVRSLIDEKTLLVVSSDFTHFGPNYRYVPFRENVRRNLRRLNAEAVHAICRADLDAWDRHLDTTRDTICGRNGIGLLLKVVEPYRDLRTARVGMDMSGEMTGDWTNSVTYDSLVFWRSEEGLTAAEQQTLLDLARKAVVHFLETGKPLEIDAAGALTPALKARRAAFVTLKNAGRLRGCIGHIQGVEPLYQSVLRNACNACQDHRFRSNPITKEEAGALTIEISALTPTSPVEDIESIVIGRDGLIMERGRRRGVFLPQVPIEAGWDRLDYLINLCGKSGLPTGAWRDPETKLYRFTAQVFREKKEPSP
jgi:hypothetical protein